MNGLDIFALLVLLVLLAAVIAVWVLLGIMPGRIARQRNHPLGGCHQHLWLVGNYHYGPVVARRLNLGLHQFGIQPQRQDQTDSRL